MNRPRNSDQFNWPANFHPNMAGMAVYWEAPLQDLRRMVTTTTISIPMGEPATYRNTQGVVVQLSSVVPGLLTTQSSRGRRQSWTPQTPQEMPRLVPQERVSSTDGQGQAPREVKEAMEIPHQRVEEMAKERKPDLPDLFAVLDEPTKQDEVQVPGSFEASTSSSTGSSVLSSFKL